MENTQNDYLKVNAVINPRAHEFSHINNDDFFGKTPAMTLSIKGIITYCNVSCAKLFGCFSFELIRQHISKFLPQIQEMMLFEGHHLNPRLRFLSHIGYHFQVNRSNGIAFDSKVFFVELGNTSENFIRVIFRPVGFEAEYS